MFFTQTLDSCLLSRSTSLLLSVLFVFTFSFIVIFLFFLLYCILDSSTVFVSVAL